MDRKRIYIAGIYEVMEELADDISMIECGRLKYSQQVYDNYEFLQKELERVKNLSKWDYIVVL